MTRRRSNVCAILQQALQQATGEARGERGTLWLKAGFRSRYPTYGTYGTVGTYGI